MTKIEERAEEYAENVEFLNGDTINVQLDCRKYGYIEGANAQLALDIKWIRENVGASVAVDFLKAQEA